jgi:hypothetical protein
MRSASEESPMLDARLHAGRRAVHVASKRLQVIDAMRFGVIVDQTGASWNQVALWLSRIKTLRGADMRVC